MAESRIETDYLVVGAGAMGMAFVDTLIEHSDADVAIVERRHRAGGHWLDSYPFVQLHQPSKNYGVNSTPLGQDRVEPDGIDAGFFERASGAEICGYYDEILRHRFLASGRVRFFPMCDYLGDRRFHSRITDQVTDVTVRRRVVDATFMASRVPATDPPPFEVAPGAACVPVGELTKLARPAAGYVIVGGGKTALDAICWLLDRGTDPDAITWIRPRDSWLLNRAYFQPGTTKAFEGVVMELEAIVESRSVEEVFERLEASEVVYRTDRSVVPTMMRGSTLSAGELEQLQRVENVVRLGHVRRIEPEQIVLEGGAVPTTPGHLHVHCAAAGLSDSPPRPIFTDDTITLQVVSRVALSLSGALLGVLEASDRTTEEKNRLCRPTAWPHTPFDFLRAVLAGINTELSWLEAPDLQAWLDGSRLNLMRGLGDHDDAATVRALQGRFLDALGPALAKMPTFARDATPRERARIFDFPMVDA
ncbi:MAG TPA: NAD(P)-binding protein [Acidimicrobiia bacterium]|nr:NAD(P)-binding protein [Acidimicrobiia bacterium]